MEATVLEVHLIITGRLDVVSVHLQQISSMFYTEVKSSAEVRGQLHSPGPPCFSCLYRPAALK